MTENEKLVRDEAEAIEGLKSNKPTSGYLMLQESIDMAIKALEEVQQYRAIGTVGKTIEECAEYEEIGTVEECRAAMEKQRRKIVKNPYGTSYIWKAGYCPVCGCGVTARWDYCQCCGQKLNWRMHEKAH